MRTLGESLICAAALIAGKDVFTTYAGSSLSYGNSVELNHFTAAFGGTTSVPATTGYIVLLKKSTPLYVSA